MGTSLLEEAALCTPWDPTASAVGGGERQGPPTESGRTGVQTPRSSEGSLAGNDGLGAP